MSIVAEIVRGLTERQRAVFNPNHTYSYIGGRRRVFPYRDAKSLEGLGLIERRIVRSNHPLRRERPHFLMTELGEQVAAAFSPNQSDGGGTNE